MKLPDGWIVTLRPNKDGTEVEMETEELFTCKHCQHFEYDSPDDFDRGWCRVHGSYVYDTDYCSYGD